MSFVVKPVEVRNYTGSVVMGQLPDVVPLDEEPVLGRVIEADKSGEKTGRVQKVVGLACRLLPLLSLYKPVGFPLAVLWSGLRAGAAWQSVRAGGVQSYASAAIETAALVGTFFAHPVGMLIHTTKDLLVAVNQLKVCLEKGDSVGALEWSARVLSHALCFALFASGGAEVAIASLAVQTVLGLYYAQKAYREGDRFEAAAHLCMALVLGYQLNQSVLAFSVQKPVSNETAQKPVSYEVRSDTAQYKHADWSGLKSVQHNLTLEEAKAFANADPEIKYFFYMKGWSMYLEGINKCFRHGDAVFFTKSDKLWLGSAPGYSDTYIKN